MSEELIKLFQTAWCCKGVLLIGGGIIAVNFIMGILAGGISRNSDDEESRGLKLGLFAIAFFGTLMFIGIQKANNKLSDFSMGIIPEMKDGDM